MCRALVWVCVCVHPLNKDVSQAIIGTFFQCILQKMVGWVALRFVIAFRWSLNRLKCDGQCLFLSYCNSCSACEMSFLTGKECPGKCAHCRSPRQKKFYMYIYSLQQLICFVSFKNQNWEMYCLLTAFYDPWSDNNFWNFWLGQISHVILSHFIFRGRGIGGGGCENNAYCFLALRMANLLTFIHNGGIWKVTAPI